MKRTDHSDESPVLTADQMARFKPAREVLPAGVMANFKGRGAQKAPKKEAASIRFSPEVLAWYRAKGKGWQTAMDRDLSGIVRAQQRARARAERKTEGPDKKRA